MKFIVGYSLIGISLVMPTNLILLFCMFVLVCARNHQWRLFLFDTRWFGLIIWEIQNNIVYLTWSLMYCLTVMESILRWFYWNNCWLSVRFGPCLYYVWCVALFKGIGWG